jgi:hypothetical protein
LGGLGSAVSPGLLPYQAEGGQAGGAFGVGGDLSPGYPTPLADLEDIHLVPGKPEFKEPVLAGAHLRSCKDLCVRVCV